MIFLWLVVAENICTTFIERSCALQVPTFIHSNSNYLLQHFKSTVPPDSWLSNSQYYLCVSGADPIKKEGASHLLQIQFLLQLRQKSAKKR